MCAHPLKLIDNFKDMHGDSMEQDYKVLLSFYMLYLGVDKPEHIELFNPTDDADESWYTPPGFTCDFEIKDCRTSRFSIGMVQFGHLDGVKVITEQNASPIIFMRKIQPL